MQTIRRLSKKEKQRIEKQALSKEEKQKVEKTLSEYNNMLWSVSYKTAPMIRTTPDDIYQELYFTVARVIKDYDETKPNNNGASLATYLFRALNNSVRSLIGRYIERNVLNKSAWKRSGSRIIRGIGYVRNNLLVNYVEKIADTLLVNDKTEQECTDEEVFKYIDKLQFAVHKRSTLTPSKLRLMLKMRYKGDKIKEISKRVNVCIPRVATIMNRLAGYISEAK